MRVIKISLLILILNQASSLDSFDLHLNQIYNYQELSSNNITLEVPAILLIGKTGAGKSTLGNYLLRTPTFKVSENKFKSETITSASALVKIGGELYRLVDTPGIFDTRRSEEEILDEITHTIQKCAFGIKAILFLFEAERFTDEQKAVIKVIKAFLGEDALKHVITVFSKCQKKDTEFPQEFQETWPNEIQNLVNSVGNRWAISPNPEIFSPGEQIFEQRLEDLQKNILSIKGIFKIKFFDDYWKHQEEKMQAEREKEAKRQKERDDVFHALEAERELRENMSKMLEELRVELQERSYERERLQARNYELMVIQRPPPPQFLCSIL